MPNAFDMFYGAGVAAASPFWLIKPTARRKVLGALRKRMGHVGVRDLTRPAIMIHAVSLGEINATRALVDKLRAARPGLQFVVSTTTDTGFARGQEIYDAQPDVTVIRYPLDFSAAVDRALDAMRPSVVVLMELELWPNFLRACRRRGIPVVLVNGRMTPYSFRGFKWVKAVARAMLRNLAAVCVQDQQYAQRFAALGADPTTVRVTGTMKFDTAQVADRVAGDEELGQAVGISTGERVLVCGSTGPGEEEIMLRVYEGLRKKFADLRLVIVPRKPERFDEVAELIAARGFAVTRRSTNAVVPGSVILGDTMGELRKFYSLASVVVVGRTLVDLGSRQHGSDMIEPAALGKPVIVGPHTSNFAEVVAKLKQAGGIVEVETEAELAAGIERLFADAGAAKEMGNRARELVVAEKGATDRHVEIIIKQLRD